MKTLYESLLDDEEDIVNDESTVIEEWCKANIKGFGIITDKNKPYSIKNGKVNLMGAVNLWVTDNFIPDYIKWGDTSTAIITCNNMNTYKNFPTHVKHLFIDSNKMPADFTTMKDVDIDTLSVNSVGVKSLKGLKGKIKNFKILIDNLNEFDADPKLKVTHLEIGVAKETKIKSIKQLPDVLDKITFDQNLGNLYKPYDDIYEICKSIISQTPELKKIFRGHLTKTNWRRSGSISAQIK